MQQPSQIELEVARIQALVRERSFADASRAAQALLGEVPENRDVLYLLALSQRQSGETTSALATLAHFEQLHPRYSRLYQERGQCFVALRQAQPAVEAFAHAVQLNAALPISWSMLESLYRMLGQSDSAATAAAHVATLGGLPPEVVTANALFLDGETEAAEQLVRAFLLRNGHHIEAMRLLARVGIELDVLDDAQLLLEGVLDVAPDYQAARFEYAQVLAKRHLYALAGEQTRKLLAANPANRNARTLQAMIYVGLGQHEQAIDLYRDLLPDALQPAELHLSIAHALKTLGSRNAAIAEYRKAAAVRPGYGEAYWSMANLKTYRFDDQELGQMESAEATPTASAEDRYNLCFALGKALEDRGQYRQSYTYYQSGNALKRSTLRYRPEVLEANTRLQRELCTPHLFRTLRGAGAQADDPILIVGLPRAGSTLIEQILASHSLVDGTQELADIPRIVANLQGRDRDPDEPRYPGVLADLDKNDYRELGEKYLTDTRVYRSHRARFIDKMPNNFRHIGLIHLMLPNARIIDARREPMACCFGIYKQLFAHGQEFAYSLEEIARYYRTYLDLMEHWNAVLPGRVLRVQHEDLVNDLDGNVRRLLEYCGLDFEPGCVEFYRTKRSVRTASSEQVRQPIYREGLEQWRNFEPWLAPLQAALGDALERYCT